MFSHGVVVTVVGVVVIAVGVLLPLCWIRIKTDFLNLPIFLRP